MVKNTTGGCKAKGQARKNFTIKENNNLRVAENEFELYAQAVKIMGGSICKVIDLQGNEMNCHIRGKFSGKGKRDNIITSGSWLLVGLREWELTTINKNKILNCDLLEVYNDSDKLKLKDINNINWGLFNSNDRSMIIVNKIEEKNDKGFDFVNDERLDEYQNLIEEEINKKGKIETITYKEETEINIDDI